MSRPAGLLVPLLWALLLSTLTLSFLKFAGEVREGETQRLDEKVLKALRRTTDPAVPIGPDWLPEIVRNLTALGSLPVLLLLVLAVAGFLTVERQWRSLTVLLITVVGTLALMVALKDVFDRPRPTVVPPLVVEASKSFPSGHATMSAVVYLTLGSLLALRSSDWLLRLYVLGVAVVLALVVGVSRVYLGVHYPSDVLAGWTVGLACALASGVVSVGWRDALMALPRRARGSRPAKS